jgi:hypothetical protein
MTRIKAATVLLAACGCLATPAHADVPGMRSILPLGQGGSVPVPDYAAYLAGNQPPPSFTRVRDQFNALVVDATHMTDELIARDFPAAPN